MVTNRVDPLGCEARAVEEGLTARSNGDGTFSVRSVSRPGVRWNVRIEAVRVGKRWCLRAVCACEGGRSRPSELCACQHGAAVLRSLERRRLAVWVEGVWEPAERLKGAVA